MGRVAVGLFVPHTGSDNQSTSRHWRSLRLIFRIWNLDRTEPTIAFRHGVVWRPHSAGGRVHLRPWPSVPNPRAPASVSPWHWAWNRSLALTVAESPSIDRGGALWAAPKGFTPGLKYRIPAQTDGHLSTNAPVGAGDGSLPPLDHWTVSRRSCSFLLLWLCQARIQRRTEGCTLPQSCRVGSEMCCSSLLQFTSTRSSRPTCHASWASSIMSVCRLFYGCSYMFHLSGNNRRNSHFMGS